MKADTTTIRISKALLDKIKELQAEWKANHGYHINYELVIRNLLNTTEQK